MIGTVARKYQNWKRFRSVYNELSRLTPRQLSDIGITRDDIMPLARSSVR
ncbi:DUF1127 domain-containing protein [Roseibium suaedae]|uniref:Uncharacterized conserved protein YjiS, DUF1127 family n=1 Tax=Roseibium suaedae TaxID=735517 RepID=A0A1M7L0D7_9HYPH|nr:DUF1127 domain-containing protein [Roseibium suaedae]SHM70952.1 Uncharacterized conserved protein YjiS, DUF1127 family [Roseibium suaedae]